MKILISADMEGITGVVAWDQVDPDHAEYSRFRRLMTEDVNAAIRGAFAGGASEVVVSDGHHHGRNILIEALDPRARLNSGSPSELSMIEGIQHGVDAVLLVGYHAAAGTLNAILCHTWTGEVTNLWLNGHPVGEIGLSAAVCGHFDAPVLMIAGDGAACNEAAALLPGIETAVVKTASRRYAAECLPPAQSQALIEAAAKTAVEQFARGTSPQPLRMDTPVRVRIEFDHPTQADNAEMIPGVHRIDGRTIAFTSPDMPTAFRAFRSAT